MHSVFRTRNASKIGVFLVPKPFKLKSEYLCELRKILLTLNSQKPVVFTRF